MSTRSGVNSVKYSIEVLSGPHQGARFSFEKPSITLGRGAENDIVLVNDPRVSREHVRVSVSANEARVENLSGKNQLLVNEKPIQGDTLKNESTFQIGDSKFKFESEFAAKVVSEPIVRIPVQPPMVARPPAVAKRPMPPPAVAASRAMRPPNQAQMNQYQQPAYSPPPLTVSPAGGSSKMKLYGGIGLALAAVIYFVMPNKAVEKEKREPVVRNEMMINRDLASLDKRIEDLKKQTEAEPSDRVRRVEENLTRGLRDFQQGNYSRAIESFQVVINVDSANLLAKRYYQVSKLKFDEQVKNHLLQAKKYKEKKNYRLCMSNYNNVKMLLGSRKDPVSQKEADKGYDLCRLCQEKGAELCQELK